MPMKGIMIWGIVLLVAYAIAFALDRIIPLPPPRKTRSR